MQKKFHWSKKIITRLHKGKSTSESAVCLRLQHEIPEVTVIWRCIESPKQAIMQTSGKAGEKLFWSGFVFVKLTVVMPRTFEGGLKYEEGDARNLKELMLNKPVMDNIYNYSSDSLKVFFSLPWLCMVHKYYNLWFSLRYWKWRVCGQWKVHKMGVRVKIHQHLSYHLNHHFCGTIYH